MSYPFSRLEISIPNASADLRYYGRYPHGDAPGGFPGVSGAAVSAATAAAALTTHIKVAAAALDAISAAAALSAQIRLNAAANDTTSAAAVLPFGMATTAIGPANYNKATTLPVLASGGATPYTYSILSQSGPDTWSINSSTGVLSATPAVPSLLVTGGGQYILDGNGFPIFASAQSDSVTVQAQDHNGVTVQRTFTIALQSALVLTSTLPGGTQSSAYSQTLTASGGASPYTWKLLKATSGSNTYALSSSGVLTGTPTVADTDTMTILCVDANGVPQSESLSITVAAAGTLTASANAFSIKVDFPGYTPPAGKTVSSIIVTGNSPGGIFTTSQGGGGQSSPYTHFPVMVQGVGGSLSSSTTFTLGVVVHFTDSTTQSLGNTNSVTLQATNGSIIPTNGLMYDSGIFYGKGDFNFSGLLTDYYFNDSGTIVAQCDASTGGGGWQPYWPATGSAGVDTSAFNFLEFILKSSKANVTWIAYFMAFNDVPDGSNVNGIGSNAAYGPTTIAANTYYTFKVPLSAFGLGAAQVLKFNLGFGATVPNGTTFNVQSAKLTVT